MIKLITSSIFLLLITGLEAVHHRRDICALPAVTGPCRAAIPRYFYNYATKECEQFTYGGCQGNANNFETLRQCRKRCDICSLPAQPGLCKASIPRFFYNPQTGECEQFIYGGCGGNANNFETLLKCEGRCKSERGCCDPLERPGNNGNPICFEGHACCADGTWSCSIGDGKTFPCGGVSVNIINNPEAFGAECINCCDPAQGPPNNPICREGCACCPDGTWSGSIGDARTYNCGGSKCIEDGTQTCGGTVCGTGTDELSEGETGFVIQIERSWIITIIGIFGIILLGNIIFMGYMHCNKSPKRKGKGYHVVKHADSEDVQDSEVNPINVH